VKKLPKGMAQFGQLRKGQVVQIVSQNYRVVEAAKLNSSKGSGLPVSHGRVTSSQGGPGLNAAPNNPQSAAAAAVALFGTPRQNPQLAALGGKPLPRGTPTVTVQLANMATGLNWSVTLPESFAVRVIG
jgi:hypothetical protein